jgi:hypothetical protein
VGVIDQLAKVLRHALDVPQGDLDKLASIVKLAFQHKATKVRVSPKELAAGLVRRNHSGPEALSVTRPTGTSRPPNVPPLCEKPIFKQTSE